jgi:hypothetical protein
LTDKCTIGILKGSTDEQTACQRKTVTDTDKYTTRIGRQKWAYSITEPSSLITVCDGKIEEQTLPTQGIVQLPETSICRFKFKNGPFMGIRPYAPGIDIQTEIEEIKDESQLQKKMIEIKDHFQEYNYIYIPIILSLTGLIMAIMLLLACCLQYVRLTRKRTRRKRTRRNKPQITPRQTETIQMRTLQLPFRAGWEIQEV